MPPASVERGATGKIMNESQPNTSPVPAGANRMLGLVTFAWTVAFAAWVLFSIIGVRIQQDLFGVRVRVADLHAGSDRLADTAASRHCE